MKDYLGELEHVVLLAVLRLGKDGYGVTIREEIHGRTGRAISPGTIYPTLDRLERKGFVRSVAGPPAAERGGRSRRLYRIAAGGLAALRASEQALSALRSGFEDVLAEQE
jgi:DNA-binding PadR family transcriptional regulator